MNHHEVRDELDSWKIWVMVAYAGIVLLFIATIYLVSSKLSQDADRRAQTKIANATQVTTCIVSARSTPNILKFLDLIDVLASNSIIANRAALAADPNGPLADIRKDSLHRLRPAASTIKSFREATLRSRRTISDCKALAKKLDVEIAPLLREGKT